MAYAGDPKHKFLGDRSHYPIAAKLPIWFPVKFDMLQRYEDLRENKREGGPSPATLTQPTTQPQAIQSQPLPYKIEEGAADDAASSSQAASYPAASGGAPSPGTTTVVAPHEVQVIASAPRALRPVDLSTSRPEDEGKLVAEDINSNR